MRGLCMMAVAVLLTSGCSLEEVTVVEVEDVVVAEVLVGHRTTLQMVVTQEVTLEAILVIQE